MTKINIGSATNIPPLTIIYKLEISVLRFKNALYKISGIQLIGEVFRIANAKIKHTLNTTKCLSNLLLKLK